MTLPVRGWNPNYVTRSRTRSTLLNVRYLDRGKGEPRDVGTFRNLILWMRRRLTRFGYWPIDRRGAASRWTTFLNANTRLRTVYTPSVAQKSSLKKRQCVHRRQLSRSFDTFLFFFLSLFDISLYTVCFIFAEAFCATWNMRVGTLSLFKYWRHLIN